MRRLFVAASVALFLSCSASDSSAEHERGLAVAWEVTKNVQSPESAYHDAAGDCLYVSQIGAGGPTGRDGDGYISKLSPDGRLLAAKWVTGLDAPKGLRSGDGMLWVSDIDHLIRIDVDQAKIVQRIEAPGAKFLNDVACGDDGTVYVSDNGAGKIFRYREGQLTVFAEGDRLESPNGLLAVGDSLIVAAWGNGGDRPGHLYALDVATGDKSLITPEPLGTLDGVESLGEAGYVVSDWTAGKIYHVQRDGTARLLQQLPQGAADLGYITDRRLLIVPQMLENKITAFELQLGAP